MKEGDKVICIDNTKIHIKAAGVKRCSLTFGKSYTVNKVCYVDEHKILIYIIDDSGIEFGYYDNRFVTLLEHRRLKLDKLNKLV